MLEFKLLGIHWNFRVLAEMLWVMLGTCLIGAVFLLPAMVANPSILIIWIISLSLWVASSDSIFKKIKGEK